MADATADNQGATPEQASEPELAASAHPPAFEDLSLLELGRRFLRSPLRTWRRLQPILADDSARSPGSPTVPATGVAPSTPVASAPALIAGRRSLPASLQMNAERWLLLLYGLALLLALMGTSALLGPAGGNRAAENTLDIGAPWLWLAFFVWLAAELFKGRVALSRWWSAADERVRLLRLLRVIPLLLLLAGLLAVFESMSAPPERSGEFLASALARFLAGSAALALIAFMAGRWRSRAANTIGSRSSSHSDDHAIASLPPPAEYRRLWARIGRGRRLLIFALVLCSGLIWLNTSGNRIEPIVIALWLFTSLLWALVFAPLGWRPADWLTQRLDAWRRIKWRERRWTIIAFALLMLLGMSFRFTSLVDIPVEMTSDHVEKIQDAYRVSSGDYKIFFPNNGGREPLQMYLLALLSGVPGLGFDFYTLKFLSALESLLTLPILFWMSLELLRDERRGFKTLVALLLTGLVAASYWHVIISRQGLRIPLTPLFTALALIYLARAMRRNQLGDFVKAGLILGFGLYAYQALRMLPALVICGVAVACLMRPISQRERLRYLLHLAALVFVALMVFLPMLHFALEYPNHFWMRASTRILGDDMAYATAQQAEQALRANVAQLMANIRKGLLMFNWQGDIGWFNGASLQPVLDVVSGAFLILGAAAWLARMATRRDPVTWFLPLALLVMLMPTALSLAHPDANPSNSRALGMAPLVYLFAALPIAMIATQITRAFSRRVGWFLALAFCVFVILLSNHHNSQVYFDRYAPEYQRASFPHSEAGSIIRGFVDSGGAIGNAWSVGYPFWWDYRALGIEAGYPMWQNDGAPIEALPSKLAFGWMRGDAMGLDPERDLLFLYNLNDENTGELLRQWFPDGREMLMQSYQPEDSYFIFRAPALGDAGLNELLSRIR